MKKIIAVSMFIALLSGCSVEGRDRDACRRSVKIEMNTQDVETAPDKNFTFIVRDDKGAVYCENNGSWYSYYKQRKDF